MLAVNKAHYPVTVLGYGTRIGIWLQGCSIRCKGCISRDTWDRERVHPIPVSAMVEWCRRFEEEKLDGITISGGEPFEQPEGLFHLLLELRRWISTRPGDMDILCYSGLPYKTLQEHHGAILKQLDAIVPEPFVAKYPTAPLRGSSNQPVITLSEIGRLRYGSLSDDAPRKRFQIVVDDGRVWFVGIPERGDMERIEKLCLERGLIFGESSWHERHVSSPNLIAPGEQRAT